MARLWQQITKGEKGQALPVVLVLLVIGGLLVTPCLKYASSSLHAGQIVKENVRGIYAADAGVEDALWCLKNSVSPIPEQLPENVNQMPVAIETEEIGEYVLYDGELIEVGEHPQEHYEWLIVGKWVVWDAVEEAYKYTIAATWRAGPGTPIIMLDEIGARLPVGYSYVLNSADDPSFPDNLSDDEPEDTLDGAGAHMLNWELGAPSQVSELNPTATQTFYITGEGGLGGDYTWVKAGAAAIGQVGEDIGTFYKITATATSGSGSSTTIEAYVVVSGGNYATFDGNFTLGGGEVYGSNVDAGEDVQLGQDAILIGNAIAGEDVQLEQRAVINGDVCAGGNVQLNQDATIVGDIYAAGDVQLEEGAIIIGNVYAGGTVQPGEGTIMGDYSLPYTGCGLSVDDSRVQILSWEIN